MFLDPSKNWHCRETKPWNPEGHGIYRATAETCLHGTKVLRTINWQEHWWIAGGWQWASTWERNSWGIVLGPPSISRGCTSRHSTEGIWERSPLASGRWRGRVITGKCSQSILYNKDLLTLQSKILHLVFLGLRASVSTKPLLRGRGKATAQEKHLWGSLRHWDIIKRV